MSEFALGYEKIAPTTWVYLSSLLMIGLFFKFNRVWSVRNLDLILLILLAPGLLLVHFGLENQRTATLPTTAEVQSDKPPDALAPSGKTNLGNAATTAGGEESSSNVKRPRDEYLSTEDLIDRLKLQASGNAYDDSQADKERAIDPQVKRGRIIERLGYLWLFVAGALVVVRMLIDPTMVRRPLLEPNLSTGGLSFIGCSLFVFLMANIATSKPTADDMMGPRSAEQLADRRAEAEYSDSLTRHGPGYAVIHLLVSFPTIIADDGREDQTWKRTAQVTVVKTMAICAHLATVVGIVLIGYRHFDNVKMGIGAATLYLMLPYMAQMTGRVPHALPAAFLIWAIVFYRRPVVAGVFLGLAAGVVYYPLFLLPLWISFYWFRGLIRFGIGMVSTLLLLVFSLIFVSADLAAFWGNVQKMFGLWLPLQENLAGIWRLGWDPVYRLPVLVAFFALSLSFALWPAQKNLGTLLSCSAALMVATQFWHGHGDGGGMYMAWYLPLMLLTIFRPNLEDRVALSVLRDGWRRRNGNAVKAPKAA